MVYASLAVVVVRRPKARFEKTDQNLRFASFVIVYVCFSVCSMPSPSSAMWFYAATTAAAVSQTLFSGFVSGIYAIVRWIESLGCSHIAAGLGLASCSRLPFTYFISLSLSLSPLHIHPEPNRMRAWTPNQTIYVHVNYFYLAAAYARSLDSVFFSLRFSFAKY